MSVYAPNAFAERVSYAKRCILNGQTNGRAFDTCFEMGDGSYVMVRLWQEAQTNERLASRLRGYGSEASQKLYEKLKCLSSREIGRLARTSICPCGGNPKKEGQHFCESCIADLPF